MKIRIRKTGPLAVVPAKAHGGDAGYDVYTSEDVFVENGLDGAARSVVPLSIQIELPDPCSRWWWKLASRLFGLTPYVYYAWLRERSGFSSKGMIGFHKESMRGRFDCDVVSGIVDCDYRGNVGVIVKNRDAGFVIPKGTKIAQLIIGRAYSAEWEEVSELSDTTRDSGGFGHTGVR